MKFVEYFTHHFAIACKFVAFCIYKQCTNTSLRASKAFSRLPKSVKNNIQKAKMLAKIAEPSDNVPQAIGHYFVLF
jgi:hypothetical protein